MRAYTVLWNDTMVRVSLAGTVEVMVESLRQ